MEALVQVREVPDCSDVQDARRKVVELAALRCTRVYGWVVDDGDLHFRGSPPKLTRALCLPPSNPETFGLI